MANRRGNMGPHGPEPMSERELVAHMWEKVRNGINDADGEISQRRQDVLDYYQGEAYGDESPEYSSAMTREVMETVEWALPHILQPLLSETVCQFQPQGEEDVEAAEQESDAVLHVLRHQNDFFENLLAWCKDALLFPNGYAKLWWDDAPESRFVVYENQTDEMLAILSQEPEITIVAVEGGGELDEYGEPTTPGLYTITVRHDVFDPKICFESVPPEEVLVDNDATCLNLDKSDFVCHHRELPRSDLLQQGYDYDLVMSLPTSGTLPSSSERDNRRETQDEDWTGVSDVGVMETVDYYECYVRIDYDGDGYAERRKVCFSANEVLYNDYCSFQPMIALGAIPQSHRHVAMGLGELAMQPQRQQSTLLRQTLDNCYRRNRPRQFTGRGVNVEQLMNYVPFGIVEGAYGTVEQEQIGTVADVTIPMMEWMEEETSGRTGVSRQLTEVDASLLASSTMGAYMSALGQASQRLELVVRNFAETGVKQLMMKTHQLLRENSSEPEMMRLRGKWVPVSPANWAHRKDMVATVGVGTGSVQERLSRGMTLLDAQRQSMEIGLSNPQRIYTTLDDLAQTMGLAGASRYFVDPEGPEYAEWVQGQQEGSQEAQAQQMAAFQAQFTAAMAQVQAKFQSDMAKIQADLLKQQQENERKWAELEVEASLDVLGKGVDAQNVTRMNP